MTYVLCYISVLFLSNDACYLSTHLSSVFLVHGNSVGGWFLSYEVFETWKNDSKVHL